MTIQHYRNQKPGAKFIADSPGTFEPLRIMAATGRPGREMAELSLDAHGAAQRGMAGSQQTAAPVHSQCEAQDWLSTIEKSQLSTRPDLPTAILVPREWSESSDITQDV